MYIYIAYAIDPIYICSNINWLDIPKDKMPDYQYSVFDWPSSQVGIRLNNKEFKKKPVTNEAKDTEAASDHLFKELNLFLGKHNGSSLDSIFMKINNVSSSSIYNLDLGGFNTRGRTDLLISQINSGCELLANYCNIQLKAVVKYKNEDSDEIFTTSDAENKKLTAQSVAELLSSIPFSKFPVMQCTTDLNKNFHIMILTNQDNCTTLNHYDLNGTEFIATIAIWLLYFCQHINLNETHGPKTKDLILLKGITNAQHEIKERILRNDYNILNSYRQVLPQLDIGIESQENNLSKCQKWVDSIN